MGTAEAAAEDKERKRLEDWALAAAKDDKLVAAMTKHLRVLAKEERIAAIWTPQGTESEGWAPKPPADATLKPFKSAVEQDPEQQKLYNALQTGGAFRAIFVLKEKPQSGKAGAIESCIVVIPRPTEGDKPMALVPVCQFSLKEGKLAVGTFGTQES